MTSIAGRMPPDLVRQDRFTIGDWASRETFRSLDELLAGRALNDARDPWHIDPAEYYPACWTEAVYQGRVDAIGIKSNHYRWERSDLNEGERGSGSTGEWERNAGRGLPSPTLPLPHSPALEV